ncbi:MAG: hypothetical protein E7677_05455, partial [Ruminococcaceae bacterium]|nr:hypothetical protein [Oscillospiraceae bacterium]
MKKLISILLSVAMLLSMLVAAIPASAAENTLGNDTQAASDAGAEKKATVPENHVPGDFDGDGATDKDAIAIDSMAKLQAMQGKKGYLTKDFVVKMSDAKPATDANNAFTIASGWPGVDTYLDGCGYTIEFDKSVAKGGADTPVALFNGSGAVIHVKNLNLTGVINASSDSHVAPLCKHGGKGDVENVVVDVDITVKSIGANASISGVWGKTDGSTPLTMKNVHFTGSIDVKCDVSTGGYGGVGGLIGNTQAVTAIENCSSSGAITVTATGTTNGNIGGLVGFSSNTLTISGSSNTSDITVKGKTPCVGGFVGRAHSKVTISNSSNSGNVNVTTTEEAYGHNGIGGFVGMIDGGNDTAKAGSITGCTNSGAVSLAPADAAKSVSNAYVGGIAGRLYRTAGFNVENCTNNGAISYSSAAGAGWGSTGGIVGTFITITNTGTEPITLQVKNCVNNAAVTGVGGVGGVLGTAKQFNHEGNGQGQINLNILGCKNYADITGTGSGNNGSYATAGVIGDVSAESSDTTLKLTVSDCLNTGAIVGHGWNAGGVLGRYMWSTATNVATVERCVNTGSVKLNRAATKEDPWLDAAGIVCQATGGSDIVINDCVNIGAISTAEATGMSTYPITNCVNTLVSGGTTTADLSYIKGTGNVYLAS